MSKFFGLAQFCLIFLLFQQYFTGDGRCVQSFLQASIYGLFYAFYPFHIRGIVTVLFKYYNYKGKR